MADVGSSIDDSVLILTLLAQEQAQQHHRKIPYAFYVKILTLLVISDLLVVIKMVVLADITIQLI